MTAATRDDTAAAVRRGSSSTTRRAVAVAALVLILAAAVAGWRQSRASRGETSAPLSRGSAATVHLNRGQRLAAEGDFRAAEEALLTAVALEPGFANAHLAIADLYDSAGRPALGAEKLKALLNADPRATHVLCRQAELYLKAEGFEKPVETARAELKRDPTCALAHTVMGMALVLANERDRAVEHLRRAHHEKPDDVRIARTLAQVLGHAGRIDEGLKVAEALEKADSESPQAAYLVGWLNLRRGSTPHAVRCLTRAVTLAGDYPAANAALGVALIRIGQTESGLSQLMKSRDSGYFDLESERAIVDAARKLRRPNAARLEANLRKATAFEERLRTSRAEWLRHPDNVKNRLALAEMEAERGDLPDARDLVVKTLKDDPNHPEALRLLERIVVRR